MTPPNQMRPNDKAAPNYNQRRLSLARDLLEGDVRHSTKVSLCGFTLQRREAAVWAVTHDALDAPVDYLNLEATRSASDLLGHLVRLREAVGEQPASETQVGP